MPKGNPNGGYPVTDPETDGRCGANHHMARLTRDDVVAIRADTDTSTAELAERHDVTWQTIHAVRKRISWKHI